MSTLQHRESLQIVQNNTKQFSISQIIQQYADNNKLPQQSFQQRQNQQSFQQRQHQQNIFQLSMDQNSISFQIQNLSLVQNQNIQMALHKTLQLENRTQNILQKVNQIQQVKSNVLPIQQQRKRKRKQIFQKYKNKSNQLAISSPVPQLNQSDLMTAFDVIFQIKSIQKQQQIISFKKKSLICQPIQLNSKLQKISLPIQSKTQLNPKPNSIDQRQFQIASNILQPLANDIQTNGVSNNMISFIIQTDGNRLSVIHNLDTDQSVNQDLNNILQSEIFNDQQYHHQNHQIHYKSHQNYNYCHQNYQQSHQNYQQSHQNYQQSHQNYQQSHQNYQQSHQNKQYHNQNQQYTIKNNDNQYKNVQVSMINPSLMVSNVCQNDNNKHKLIQNKLELTRDNSEALLLPFHQKIDLKRYFSQKKFETIPRIITHQQGQLMIPKPLAYEQQRMPVFLRKIRKNNPIYPNFYIKAKSATFYQQQNMRFKSLLKDFEKALHYLEFMNKKVYKSYSNFKNKESELMNNLTLETFISNGWQNSIQQIDLNNIRPQQNFIRRKYNNIKVNQALNNYIQIVDYYGKGSLKLFEQRGRQKYFQIRTKFWQIQKNIKMISQDIYSLCLQMTYPSHYYQFLRILRLNYNEACSKQNIKYLKYVLDIGEIEWERRDFLCRSEIGRVVREKVERMLMYN